MPCCSLEMGIVAEKNPEHLLSSGEDAAVAFGSYPPQTSCSGSKILLLGAMSCLLHRQLASHRAGLRGAARAVLPHPEDAALCQAT